MTGTVSISLEDFTSLLEASKKADDIKSSTQRAAKELQVFLTFLCDRENISKYTEEFNKQSKTSQIIIVNGRAQIKFNDD